MIGSIPKLLRLGNPRQLTLIPFASADISVHPKPPKVGLHTSLRGPAYIGERLPIVIGMENREDETVTLEIQYGIPDPEQEGGSALLSSLTKRMGQSHGRAMWMVLSTKFSPSERFSLAPNANAH
jgi:hypothetical protein